MHVGRVHCLIHHCIPPCWGPPSCKVTPRPLAPGCTLHPGWQLCCWCGSMWQGQGWQYLHGRAELGWWGHWVGGESGMTTVECLHCPHHVLTPSLLLCALLPRQPLSACVGYRGHPWSPGHGPTCDPRPTPSHPIPPHLTGRCCRQTLEAAAAVAALQRIGAVTVTTALLPARPLQLWQHHRTLPSFGFLWWSRAVRSSSEHCWTPGDITLPPSPGAPCPHRGPGTPGGTLPASQSGWHCPRSRCRGTSRSARR